MNDTQIKHMVDRFLGWKLPENFRPDCGISFEPRYNVGNIHGWPEGKHEPVGTNLFDATQAEAMVRYMLEGLPEYSAIPRLSTEVQELRAALLEFIWAGDWEQPMMPPELAGRSPEYVWGCAQTQTLHDLIEALKARASLKPETVK